MFLYFQDFGHPVVHIKDSVLSGYLGSYGTHVMITSMIVRRAAPRVRPGVACTVIPTDHTGPAINTAASSAIKVMERFFEIQKLPNLLL